MTSTRDDLKARARRDWICEILAEKEQAKKEADAIRRARTRTWRTNNAKARSLDAHTCRLCAFTLCLEVHHILPVSEGGTDQVANLITLCPNHHAMAHRGLFSSEQLFKMQARRTRRGRQMECDELMAEVAKGGSAAGNNPAKLAEWHAAMRILLPERIGEIFGYEYVNASRGFFPPLPHGVSG